MAKRVAPRLPIDDEFARLSLGHKSRRRVCVDLTPSSSKALGGSTTDDAARASLMRRVRDDPSQQALYVLLRYQPDRERLRELHAQALARRAPSS
jgi:hypothetical protein